jgi:hypothetical protein
MYCGIHRRIIEIPRQIQIAQPRRASGSGREPIAGDWQGVVRRVRASQRGHWWFTSREDNGKLLLRISTIIRFGELSREGIIRIAKRDGVARREKLRSSGNQILSSGECRIR